MLVPRGVCRICFDRPPPGAPIIDLGCGHALCISCAQHYVKSSLQVSATDMSRVESESTVGENPVNVCCTDVVVSAAS